MVLWLICEGVTPKRLPDTLRMAQAWLGAGWETVKFLGMEGVRKAKSSYQERRPKMLDFLPLLVTLWLPPSWANLLSLPLLVILPAH